MSTRTLQTRIQLRRDVLASYEAIKDTFIPLKGEVLLVDTPFDGLRSKVGDGVKTFAQLSYTDQNLVDLATSIVVWGYYEDGRFYSDPECTTIITPYSYKVYINRTDYMTYGYSDQDFSYHKLDQVPTATSSVSGTVKLYSASGSNTDGTMTQKVISDEIGKKVSVSIDEAEQNLIFTKGI